jgi:isoamylase
MQHPTPGTSYPLGATVVDGGVNFVVYTKSAASVTLLLFDDVASGTPTHHFTLNPDTNRTYHYWHIFIPGIGAGQLYGWCVQGPYDPPQGYRYDGDKLLLDPYTRAVMVPAHYSRDAAKRPGYTGATAMKSVVVDPKLYEWEGDVPLQRPFQQMVIYEMHVGGFTRHPSSKVTPAKRGTYAGLIEKIPYLQALGVTALELLPVHQFDPQDAPRTLENYWGYSPIAFFAPHQGYSSDKSPLGAVNEFRDMVKALHRAGIEVILDVVFNHTAEGDETGPILSMKGFENLDYYILAQNPAYYANYSGCGNTLKCNNSIVRRLILDCLRYWVQEMHVDGFRFDLASIFSRDENGNPIPNPPILWEIETDPVLAGTKIIAEAWDAGGLYQVGSFAGHRWAEWNGKYRDDVRRFVKSDPALVDTMATRILGSPDLYRHHERAAKRSVNFVTCHDGFTLYDLVSYNDKHNEANLENNRDGSNDNHSWNCGAEGPTRHQEVNRLRERQMKNLLTIMFLSQGTPMLTMGDEVARTQKGNNNAYCQNNAISWFDWGLVEKNGGLLRFVRHLIAFNQSHTLFQQSRFWIEPDGDHPPRITWHGKRLNKPGGDSHCLAFTLHDHYAGELLHVMLNAHWQPHTFALPTVPRYHHWYRIIDTALPSPDDFSDISNAPTIITQKYRLEARSVVVLRATT